jgi:hypothetical protein
MAGKGAPRQDGQLGRGRCEHGGLGHKEVAGGNEGLCRRRGEVQEAVLLGYPRPGRLGAVSYTLSRPSQQQSRP